MGIILNAQWDHSQRGVECQAGPCHGPDSAAAIFQKASCDLSRERGALLCGDHMERGHSRGFVLVCWPCCGHVSCDGRGDLFDQMTDSVCLCRTMSVLHYMIWKYSKSTSKAHGEVPQNFTVGFHRIGSIRMEKPLRTTQDIVSAVGRPGKPSKGKGKGAKQIHPATRVFQVTCLLSKA